MNHCLKIGRRLIDGDQLVSALVQYQMLRSLVGQVILDEVIAEIHLSPQEILNRICPDRPDPSPEDLQIDLNQWCIERQITAAYFKSVTLREWRIEKFKQLQFSGQVESEFLRNKANLDQVEYSLLQLENPSLAQELYFQLRDDQADFAQLAQQYSCGDEKTIGGWVGPVTLSSLPPNVTALFNQRQIGCVHPPLVVGDRFWIVRLESVIDARLTEVTRILLMNQLYERWLQAQVEFAIATPGAIALHTQTAAPNPTLAHPASHPKIQNS